jgi:hypothetical protein
MVSDMALDQPERTADGRLLTGQLHTRYDAALELSAAVCAAGLELRTASRQLREHSRFLREYSRELRARSVNGSP